MSPPRAIAMSNALTKIKASYKRFSASQRQLADYIAQHPDEAFLHPLIIWRRQPP